MRTLKQHDVKTASWLILLPLYLMISCGGGNGEDTDPTDGTSPSAATLLFPEENTECNEGVVINDAQSRVTFRWNASQNTDSYEVTLRNLNTNNTEITPATTNEADVVLGRGIPYEWYVTSKSNGTNTTTDSAKWKFYNQGPGTTQYAPFPANALQPGQGETVNSTNTITLQWSSDDVDNDIVNHEVRFSTQNPPTTVLATTAQNSVSTNVTAGQIYYWQVTTRDSMGNTSTSTIFQFRVQ